MENKQKKSNYLVLVLITTPKLADKASDLFKKEHIAMIYRFNAQGTASSEIMDMLGLGSVDKGVLVSMIPKQISTIVMKKLKKELKMEAVNSGIAFTIPMNGANSYILKVIEGSTEALINDKQERNETIMSEMKHSLIAVIVNRGFSGDVMEAARAAGATGGTLIHSRRAGDEEAAGFWGLSVQEEQEIVIILSDAENKIPIMQSISDRCGMKSEAKGAVISMPIDSVIGI